MIMQKYLVGRLILLGALVLSLRNAALAHTRHNPTLPWTSCGEGVGRVEEITIPTRVLEKEIDARIYLPPCYDSAGPFPVLYLLHGLDNTSEQWVRIGAPAVADELIAQREIAPLIIVMPQDNMENHFDSAVVDEILPFIDGNFHTIPDRAARAIGGLSYGGAWAAHVGLQRADLFSRIGAHSPGFFYGDAGPLTEWARHLPPGTFISIDIGRDDTMVSCCAMLLDDVLSTANVEHSFNMYPGLHEEAYWSEHVAEYLKFYTQGW